MRLVLTGGALPQREQIIIRYETRLHGIPGCRIRTSSLHKGAVFHAPSMNYPWETIVSLNAARLVIKSVILVVLPGELLLGGTRRVHTVGSSAVTTYSTDPGVRW
jgi:hypothetical protein